MSLLQNVFVKENQLSILEVGILSETSQCRK